jgi:DNA-binding response OmpR family regulator
MIGILLLVSADQFSDELLARLRAGELVGLADASAAHGLADLTGIALTTPQHGSPQPDAARPEAGLRLDPDHRTVVLDGRSQPLTFLEYQLLSHLMAYPRQVQSRARLITKVWDFDPIGSGRSVDVLVARLRRKLGPTYRASIETVRSAGYRYVPPGEWDR